MPGTETPAATPAVNVETRGLLLNTEVRAIDEESRTVTYVIATENGVDTWEGKEYLRIDGVRLKRFRSNPVVLDTHNRYEIGAIVGKAMIRKEGRTLVADVTFAENTVRAEEAWQLVKTGFSRATSVGFIRFKTMELADGETDGEGERQITGPGIVVTDWELFELSIVPVPADAAALRRSFNDKEAAIQFDPVVRALVNTIHRLTGGEVEEGTMEEKKTPPAEKIEAEEAKPTAQQRQLSDNEILHAEIRSLLAEAPKDVREGCVIDCKTLDEARDKYRAWRADNSQPVGTPESPRIAKKDEDGGKTEKRTAKDVDRRDLAQSIGAL